MIIVTGDDIPSMIIVETVGLVYNEIVQSTHVDKNFLVGMKNIIGGEE